MVHPFAAAAPRHPRLRRLGRVLGFALLTITVLIVGALVYLRTDPGRSMLARGLERVVSDEIPGSMTIGSIERIGIESALLHDVRFVHANGNVVLHVKRAEIDFDVQDLLRRRVSFQRARVDGGVLVIAVQPNGRTGLEAAFSAAGKSEGRPAQLDMRSMHVQNLTLVIRPGGDEIFRLRNTEGFVSILQTDTPGVRVRLDRISGTLQEPKVLGSTLAIERADGWVHGAVPQVLELQLRARLDGERLDVHLRYFDRAKTPVELELDPHGGVKANLAAFGVELQSWFSDTIDVDLH